MKIISIVIGIILVGVVAFAMDYQSKTELNLRYKITVNVETPDGIKSGSAVREFSINKFQGFNPDKADFDTKMRGEAVIIDLEELGKLFALIERNSYTEMLYAFPIAEQITPLSPQGIEYYRSLELGAKAPLKNRAHWPRFVTFTDIANPESVEAPYVLEGCNSRHPECNGSNRGIFEKLNRMEEFFGPGVSIKSIEIEVTQEEIEWRIASVLPWFEDYKNKKARLNGSTDISISTSELSDNLGTGVFSTGEER